jgi:endoglucanase
MQYPLIGAVDPAVGAVIIYPVMQRVLRSTLAVFGGLLGFVVVSGSVSLTTASAVQPLAVKVLGNDLVNGSNQPMRLVGMDRSGTEYACVHGFGFFDGPSDSNSVAAMGAWHSDAVRVPLNEDCWLGINGVNPAFSGVNYRVAIQNYVGLLNNAGMVAVLDLHWNAPGSSLATGQQVMADADHSISFWSSVATAFRTNPAVVFDLYNEPHDISWSCWRNGCTTSAGWHVAGMQQMLDAVRNAGATQPVMIGGLNWANDLSGWLANEPSDPLHQLVASAHLYNFTGCNTSTCWNQTLAPIAASVPLVTGELGENDCSSGFINSYMSWADSVGVSYLGWTWDTWDCRSGPSLITSYSGSPTAFGAGLQTHMATLAAQSPIFAPSGSPGSPPPNNGSPQLNFSNDVTNGWRVAWGSDAAVAPGVSGLSLQLTGTGYPGFSGPTGLSSLSSGATVTDEIDNPSGASIQIVPFTQDSAWAVHFAPASTLASGWNSVTWTVPPQSGMNAIGLQVNDPNNWSGQLVLGSVSW